MSMGVVARGQAEVFVDFHHALLLETDNPRPDFVSDQPPGALIVPLPRAGARILTGLHTGGIAFTWTIHDASPLAAAEATDQVDETDVYTSTGSWEVMGLTSDYSTAPPLIEAGPPGRYRVRVTYRNRDAEWDLSATLAIETFHLDVWPARAD